MPVCLLGWLHICLPACLSVCPSVCLSACLSECQSVCLPVYLPAGLPAYTPACPRRIHLLRYRPLEYLFTRHRIAIRARRVGGMCPSRRRLTAILRAKREPRVGGDAEVLIESLTKPTEDASRVRRRTDLGKQGTVGRRDAVRRDRAGDAVGVAERMHAGDLRHR